MQELACFMHVEFGEVSSKALLEAVVIEAKSCGLSTMVQELEDIKTAVKENVLPTMGTAAALWDRRHDGSHAAQAARLRQSALLLSDLEAQLVLLKRLPPGREQDWTYMSTSSLLIKEDMSVHEHFSSMYALMPHDLCCGIFSLAEFKER